MSDTHASQRIMLLLVPTTIVYDVRAVLEVGTKLGHEDECRIREVMRTDAIVANAQIEERRSHRLGSVCDAVARDVPHAGPDRREVDEGLGRFDEIVVLPPPGPARVSHVPRLQVRTNFRYSFYAAFSQLDPERQHQGLEVSKLRSSQ